MNVAMLNLCKNKYGQEQKGQRRNERVEVGGRLWITSNAIWTDHPVSDLKRSPDFGISWPASFSPGSPDSLHLLQSGLTTDSSNTFSKDRNAYNCLLSGFRKPNGLYQAFLGGQSTLILTRRFPRSALQHWSAGADLAQWLLRAFFIETKSLHGGEAILGLMRLMGTSLVKLGNLAAQEMCVGIMHFGLQGHFQL